MVNNTIFFNASLNMTQSVRHITDTQLIKEYCSSFNLNLVILQLFIVFIISAKIFVARRIAKYPELEGKQVLGMDIEKAYFLFDDFMNYVLLIFGVVILCVWLAGVLGI